MISWCDSNKYPERFAVFKKSVKSLRKYLPKEGCLTVIIDNDSSPDVRAFIESSAVFDLKIMLEENIHDVGAYAVLAAIARDQKIEYIWILENDYILYDIPNLKSASAFLKKHPECGYMRMQKFEYKNQHLFDKGRRFRNVDKENAVWLKNIESDEVLNWEGPFSQRNKGQYFINNWHFGLHGGLVPLNVWDKIFPKNAQKLPYYYKLESSMRNKYQELGLKTAVMDKGVFSMEADSVYQKNLNVPLLTIVSEKIMGPKGGYFDAASIKYYTKNYHNYAPAQIQLFSNSLGNDELEALKSVFSSKWLGYGPRSKEFESQFAQMIGCKYALGITSCTSGLFMSMEILNIGPGDEVIVPSIGFIGAANAVIKAGATPVFADVDPRYFNLAPSEVERLLTKKTKAIIVMHYGGVPAEINKIKMMLKSQKQKIYIIEDSANSIKSTYYGKYCGALGDIGLFSLDANKIITTGTGGVMTINDDTIYNKAKVVRFYGLKPTHTSGYDAMRAKRERWWEIELEYPGNRYLINDITSAIALAQMPKLDEFINKRKQIWELYNKQLAKVPDVTTPQPPQKISTSSYYFYWIQVKNEMEQLSLARYFVKNGIYTSFRYYPLHLIKMYKQNNSLPMSEAIANTTLNLPLHQNLTQRDIHRVVNTIKEWAKDNRKLN